MLQPPPRPLSQLLTTLLSLKPNLQPAIIHIATRARMYPEANLLAKHLISRLGPAVSSTSILAFSGPKSTRSVIDVVIVSLTQLNLVEDAEEAFRGSDHPPSVVACNWILYALLKRGRVDCLWKLYSDILHRGIQPNVFTYTLLINACRHAGHAHRALSLLTEMLVKKIDPTVHTYTTLICCLSDSGDLRSAVNMLKMVKRPSLYAYNALMDGHFKNADARGAVALYGKILEEGLLPNEVTFCTLIDGLCKHGDVAEASRLFSVDMAEFGVVPNVNIYNCLIDGFFKLRCLGEAFMIYAKMKKVGLPSDTVTYGILIKGLCSARSVQEAVGLLSVMHGEGISANTVICNSVINGYCKQGDMVKATETCSWMSEKGIEPNVITFSLLIDGHCKKGEMENALGVYNEMMARGFDPDVVTYTTLINGYSKSGDLEKVSRLEREMVEKDVETNVVTDTCLIDGLCRAGRTASAIKLFLKKMDSQQFKPNRKTYMALIYGLYRAGQYFKAGRFYFLMRESGLVPDVVTYILLMHGQCLFGYTLNAMMLQADMMKNGVIPEKWYISCPMVRRLFENDQMRPFEQLEHRSTFMSKMPSVRQFDRLNFCRICWCWRLNWRRRGSGELSRRIGGLSCYPATPC